MRDRKKLVGRVPPVICDVETATIHANSFNPRVGVFQNIVVSSHRNKLPFIFNELYIKAQLFNQFLLVLAILLQNWKTLQHAAPFFF